MCVCPYGICSYLVCGVWGNICMCAWGSENSGIVLYVHCRLCACIGKWLSLLCTYRYVYLCICGFCTCMRMVAPALCSCMYVCGHLQSVYVHVFGRIAKPALCFYVSAHFQFVYVCTYGAICVGESSSHSGLSADWCVCIYWKAAHQKTAAFSSFILYPLPCASSLSCTVFRCQESSGK